MIEVSIVPKEHIDTFWEQVAPLLEPAAEQSHGRYLIGDVYTYITDYDDVLWVAHDNGRIVGAAVTRQVIYPQKTMLNICFWGGEFPIESWGPHLLELIQRYAKELKFDGIEAYGRFGWVKKLEPYGYRKCFEVFELPI